MVDKLNDEEVQLCRKAFAQFDKDGAFWRMQLLLLHRNHQAGTLCSSFGANLSTVE